MTLSKEEKLFLEGLLFFNYTQAKKGDPTDTVEDKDTRKHVMNRCKTILAKLNNKFDKII